MLNWTMLPHLSDLWEWLLDEFPDERNKRFFFDLADPQKRPREQLRGALKTLARFETQGEVTLGLNENEARQVARVLDLKEKIGAAPETIIEMAQEIRGALDIAVCAIHLTRFAAAANQKESAWANGPFTPRPKISTGAGDHFNAGFCGGQIIGAPLEIALQIGVATSGYYVRQAHSPSRVELAEFLRGL